jgi:hypothetical protein
MKQRFLLLSRYAIFAAALLVFLAGQSTPASTVVVGTCKPGLTSLAAVSAPPERQAWLARDLDALSARC